MTIRRPDQFPEVRQANQQTSTFRGALDGRVKSARPTGQAFQNRTRGAGAIVVYVQPHEPPEAVIGSLWFDTDATA